MRIPKLALAAIVTVSTSGLSMGQDPLMELYGKGVHTYFRGDHTTGANILTEAISAGLRDPRAFYYRGLCNMSVLGIDSAIADFEEGARLEMLNRSSVDIGRSLERIQGHARAEIEKARSKAKLAARATILEQQKSRLEMMLQKGAGAVLVTPEEGSPFGATTTPLAPNDPLREAPKTPRAPDVLQPSEVDTIPFPTTDPVKPADDDIFGGGSTTPATPKSDDSDPFAF
ncbi:hypothetical protein SH449x_000456 [Pirellulaceae bacterium SH449]